MTARGRLLTTAACAIVAVAPCPPHAAGLPTVMDHAGTDTTLPAGALMKARPLTTAATSSYQDWNWANPDPVYVYSEQSGNLGVVTRDSRDNTLNIDTYDPATLTRTGEAVTVPLSGWPDWGGFYAGPDGYFYVLVGQENPSEDDNLDAVQVRRYDDSWKLIGTASVQGGATQGSVKGIYSPFDAGDAHMTLVGNRLVVHMARTIYAIQGVHHQVNLTFEVDVDTMTATTFDQLGEVAYSSHSFQQLVAMNGSDLVMVDHGDAYPRAIQLGVMAGYPDQRNVTTYDLLPFPGAEGNNFTGASVTDLISGPDGVLVLGNSIQQSGGSLGSPDERRNAFAISADPADGNHTVHWLTAFSAEGSRGAMESRAVQVGEDRYAVLVGVQDGPHYRLEYRLIDSAGDVLASTSFPDVFYATICEPIVVGETIYWVGDEPTSSTSKTSAYLFGVDVSDPTTPVLTDVARAITPTPGTITVVSPPRLKGQFRVGEIVRTSRGEWSPAPTATRYRWYRNGHRIRGVHGAPYLIKRGDENRRLRVKATVTRVGYRDSSSWTNTRSVR